MTRARAPAPIETKVTASAVAAAVSGFVLWVLDEYVFVEAVPDAVSAVITVAAVAASTWAIGYLAPHTPRPDGPTDVPPPSGVIDPDRL